MTKYLACTLKGEGRVFLANLPYKYAIPTRKNVHLQINGKWNGPFAILNVLKDFQNKNLPTFPSDTVKLEVSRYFRIWEEDKNRWCTEHKAKVERYLNEELPVEATIHHIDSNRYNNELSNFYICDRKEHDAIEQGLVPRPTRSNLAQFKKKHSFS